jgi:tetratricopeptide (TPR) repeat protein
MPHYITHTVFYEYTCIQGRTHIIVIYIFSSMEPILHDQDIPVSKRFDRLHAIHYHNSFRLKSEATKLLVKQQEYRRNCHVALRNLKEAIATKKKDLIVSINKNAIEQIKKSFMISIDLYGNNHYSCLEDGILLAKLLTNANIMVPALETLDLCAKIQASENPHPHPIKCLKICHALGDMYMRHTNKIEEAKRCYIQSTIIADKRFGKLDIRSADCYHDVCSFFTRIGDIEMALHFEGKALLIKTANYGIYSNETVETQINVAVLYRLLRQYQKAISELNKVLKIYIKLYGDHSLEVATTNVSIGYTYKSMNYLFMAEKAYKEAFNL